MTEAEDVGDDCFGGWLGIGNIYLTNEVEESSTGRGHREDYIPNGAGQPARRRCRSVVRVGKEGRRTGLGLGRDSCHHGLACCVVLCRCVVLDIPPPPPPICQKHKIHYPPRSANLQLDRSRAEQRSAPPAGITSSVCVAQRSRPGHTYKGVGRRPGSATRRWQRALSLQPSERAGAANIEVSKAAKRGHRRCRQHPRRQPSHPACVEGSLSCDGSYFFRRLVCLAWL